MVRLCYKEAIIRGFTLKGIQQYIAYKTNTWIGWSCLEQLKETEEQENREWYLRLANDHFAYIAVYRDAIDSLQQITHELWKIVMDDKSSPSDKTAAMKEIHNIEKTKVLLLRDLPFITRLSKFYDLSLFNNSLSDKSDSYHLDNNPKYIPEFVAKELNDKSKDKNQFNNDSVEELMDLINGGKLDMNNATTNDKNNIDNDIME